MAHRYNKWTDYEDNILTELVQKYGIGHWSTIAKEMKANFQISKRNGKQCRERWFNQLDRSNVSRKWTEQEDLRLIKVQAILGTRWIQIAENFPGRSDNNVKNHFYSIVRKSIRKMCRYVSIKTTSMKVYSIKPSTLSKIFVQAACESAEIEPEQVEPSSHGLNNRFKNRHYCEITQIIHFFIFDNHPNCLTVPPSKEQVIEALNRLMDINNIFQKDSSQDVISHESFSGSEKKESLQSKNEFLDKEIQEMKPEVDQCAAKSQNIEIIQKIQIEEEDNSYGIFNIKARNNLQILQPQLSTMPNSSQSFAERKDLLEADVKLPSLELLNGMSQLSLNLSFGQINLNEPNDFQDLEMMLFMTPRRSGTDNIFNKYLQ